MTRLTTTIDKLDLLCKIVSGIPNRKIVAVVRREPNVTISRIGPDGTLVKIVTDDAVDIIHTTS